MKWLVKLVKRSNNYAAFEARAMSQLKWYGIPPTWTKKDLAEFYQKNGGK